MPKVLWDAIAHRPHELEQLASDIVAISATHLDAHFFLALMVFREHQSPGIKEELVIFWLNLVLVGMPSFWNSRPIPLVRNLSVVVVWRCFLFMLARAIDAIVNFGLQCAWV